VAASQRQKDLRDSRRKGEIKEKCRRRYRKKGTNKDMPVLINQTAQ
jgi:hypothetical protein